MWYKERKQNKGVVFDDVEDQAKKPIDRKNTDFKSFQVGEGQGARNIGKDMTLN